MDPWNDLLRFPTTKNPDQRGPYGVACPKGSRGMGEVHMLHFPEVQLDVSMEASEGHKGAHNRKETLGSHLGSVLGLK